MIKFSSKDYIAFQVKKGNENKPEAFREVSNLKWKRHVHIQEGRYLSDRGALQPHPLWNR